MQKKYLVVAEWDSEAGVWVATSDDVPGLVTEAATMDELVRKLQVMVPEMLELNGVIEAEHAEIPFALMTEVAGIAGRC